jgi:hypothetical protein
MDADEGDQEDPQSLHKYLYCEADAVGHTDPSGHDLDSMPDISSSIFGQLLIGLTPNGFSGTPSGTCGPDVTAAVMNTMNNVEQTFISAPYQTKVNAAANILTHPIDTMNKGWDIEPLFELGYTIPVDFGNGSSLGIGFGAYTVQFGIPPKVYYAGSVNYILWGRLNFLLYNTFRNPVTGAGDPLYSEAAAVAAARIFKALGHYDFCTTYAKEAGAFVKFGYDATDPSGTSLPLAPNPMNTAASSRFKWRWLGLRDNFE